jgi:hypothetical protein
VCFFFICLWQGIDQTVVARLCSHCCSLLVLALALAHARWLLVCARHAQHLQLVTSGNNCNCWRQMAWAGLAPCGHYTLVLVLVPCQLSATHACRYGVAAYVESVPGCTRTAGKDWQCLVAATESTSMPVVVSLALVAESGIINFCLCRNCQKDWRCLFAYCSCN